MKDIITKIKEIDINKNYVIDYEGIVIQWDSIYRKFELKDNEGNVKTIRIYNHMDGDKEIQENAERIDKAIVYFKNNIIHSINDVDTMDISNKEYYYKGIIFNIDYDHDTWLYCMFIQNKDKRYQYNFENISSAKKIIKEYIKKIDL